MRTNAICITDNLSWRMRRTNFSEMLRYNRITKQPDLVIINNNKKKRTCRIVDFAVPADQSKESEKNDKYLDFAREFKKKLWSMKVSLIPIVIGTVTKEFIKGLENVEKENEERLSKQQHCWDKPEYWEESWRLQKTCCHSNSSEKPSVGVKKLPNA